MDLLDAGRIVAGLVLLIVGGELLVRGASALARRAGISALVVGLTVVSVATSSPELAVTLGAVLRDEPGLAVGNAVGSNIANILLILGVCAVVTPLLVRRRLVRLDLPLMAALSAALLLMALDGRIGAWDGIVLLAAMAGYLALTVVTGRREAAAGAAGDSPAAGAGAPADDPPLPVPRSLLLVAGGVGLLVLGANLLVEGAVNAATAAGVSSLVVGLTVVAVGTSLPELAVSVIAVRRGERDLAVGNVVGSNIANIGLILGLPAVLSGDGLPVPDAAAALDIPLMLAAAVALLPIAFTGFSVARWEGALFLGLYTAYTAYVVLAATEHDALDGFTAAMAWFVLPLVAMTLIAVTAYEFGRRAGRPGPDPGEP
ncbi:calcium/sodium antiporter [Streptomyces aidingensis]|uniref:Cation:H+ antiporter n=1 Tax=Streptomyces aidingensis TaxID=910347 RepID=A0A1I1SU38_9ACTN|nr:calcium/sodium antiporter [Streptomyces aidingensis]SFD46550.1 cation:H+ antiporter [Streptomyces aidingensis]